MNSNQYGFRPGRNIDDCKYKFFKHIKSLERGKLSKDYVAIFIDLSSAYDHVSR